MIDIAVTENPITTDKKVNIDENATSLSKPNFIKKRCNKYKKNY